MQKQRVVPVLLGLVLGCALAVDAQTINLGQTLSGTLVSTDGRSAACVGCYADLYQLTVPAGSPQMVFITLTSSVFDTTLRLYDSGGRLLIENDDDYRVDTTNSFIGMLLNPGTYRIEATSFSPGDTGEYSLAVQGTVANLRTISTGQTVSGNLSANSGRTVTGFGSPADLYEFTVTSQQLLVITMRSTGLNSYVFLMDSTGVYLADDDDSGGGSDAQIARTLAPGTYRIEATTHPGQAGAYTLSLQGTTPTVSTISVGQTVNGSLTSTDGRSVGCGGCYADLYQFTLTSSQTLGVALSSSAFDTYLRIMDANGNELATDDDGGGRTNSFIQRVFAAGTYRIEATSYDSGVGGAYTLSLSTVNIQVRPITVGATVTGNLTAAAGRSSGCTGCFADLYEFSVTSSQTLRILLTSAAFDAFLRVLDSTGKELDTDDDNGGGSNSLITRSFAPGTYRIEATTYDGGETGAYTLALTAPTVTVSPITVSTTATTVNSSLSATSGSSVGCAGCFANLYQFALSSSQIVEIRLTSTAFDTYLRVLDSSRVAVAADDDGGGGTDSLIRRTFNPGTYLIEVTSYSSGATGAFSLSVVVGSSTVVSPVLLSLSPSSARAGSAGFTLIVNGNSFANSAVVRWDGNNRATTFVSSTQLRAEILTNDLATSRDVSVTIVSGGAGSNALIFRVTVSTPLLTVAPEFLQFSALENQTGIAAQNITVGGNVGWTVPTTGVRTSSGGNWLQISPTAGSGPATSRVSVNVAGLSAGAYTGLITFQGTTGGLVQIVAVTLVVSRAVPILQPTQSGFLFQGIEGQTIPPQTFQVLNVGSGSMEWEVLPQTSDGRNWLSVSPLTGSTAAGSSSPPPTVTVRVDSSQLRGGVSVGLLTLRTRANTTPAPNSPQVGLVLVNVMPAGSDPVFSVQPAGFVFSGTVNSTAPAARDLTISASGGTGLTYSATVATSGGGNWLSVSPASGSLTAGQATLSVRPNISGLASGVYSGTVSVTLNAGVRQDLAVLLILTDAAVAAQGALPGPHAVCTPTKLTLVETQLAGNFTVSVGWPVSLRTLVVNDCGQPVPDATVIATFNTGDAPLTLASLKDGNYTGNWIPSKPDRTIVTVRARKAEGGLAEAVATLDGKVAASATALPSVARNGTVNGASFQRYAPVAPGSLVSVFGTNLGTSTMNAGKLPLPTTLADVRVQLGGKDVPLVYARTDQVNAQIPTDLVPGTTASLVVTVRGVAAAPDQITLSDAQPGIFTVNAAGQGAIQISNTATFAAPAGSIPGAEARPVDRSGFITIYCTGLGATEPPVASGMPAPTAEPLARVKIPVTVNIGGIEVSSQFSGLSPGFVGLYQVNIAVPSGVAPGDAVPVFLTQGGVKSNTVTIAVR